MYEDALARVELFSGLGKKELKDLAAHCSESTYRPGSVLLSQGEQGLGLYILTKGTVRITRKNSPDGAEEVLATAGVGDVIGELALLDDLPRSATVTAVDEVTRLKLALWEFRRFLRRRLRREPDVWLDRLAVFRASARNSTHPAQPQ